ncbi:Phosphatidylserine/phosphatidylglycerophosphate/cardiolipin synthase [Actinomadura meyerae]|jgi:hypothetical protein|uniref:phospholipase D n=1 Tax=Actinomadura meyerae TaxID=240840 RepID=A0A239NR29_9ACTN|nr:phospholipase D-like domain-containing protein [Actinomadura meyerae]SNT56923.1 Phosphatidylserine/phosphatidylglycerophosphate/cardiolipin synthase [Actinomadura meyerae]
MSVRISARPLAAAAALLLLLAGALAALVAAPPARAALPKPVLGGPVFNYPMGTAAQQRAIFDQIIKLIDATPAGEEIRASVFDFTDLEVAQHLMSAFQRGVKVKVIIDDSSYLDGNANRKASPAFDLLRQAQPNGLGMDDSKASWLIVCDDRYELDDGHDDYRRGCSTSRTYTYSTGGKATGYNHNKFFLFSRITGFDDGTSYQKVVLQTSSNLTNWYKVQSYNDAVTFVDPTVYDGYYQYHQDMRANRYGYGNDNYYRSTPSGGTYRAFFFPRKENSGEPFSTGNQTDTVANALKEVSCAYTGTDGKRHQTDVRIVMSSFTRTAIAGELSRLRRAGCWVDVVYDTGGMSAAVHDELDWSGGPQLVPCQFTYAGRGVQPHNKIMMIDGDYNGSITPRVYTGSHNFNISALRLADETLLRITSAAYHASYLSYFYTVRDQCRRGAP